MGIGKKVFSLKSYQLFGGFIILVTRLFETVLNFYLKNKSELISKYLCRN